MDRSRGTIPPNGVIDESHACDELKESGQYPRTSVRILIKNNDSNEIVLSRYGPAPTSPIDRVKINFCPFCGKDADAIAEEQFRDKETNAGVLSK